MRHDVLMSMSKTELDSYAAVLGFDVSGKKTIPQKVAQIEKRRERTAEVEVLGLTVSIPIKRMHDKRVTDLMSKRPMTDQCATDLLVLLLGDDQMSQLINRATDDDGTVDVDAMGLAIARILGSEDLKNF